MKTLEKESLKENQKMKAEADTDTGKTDLKNLTAKQLERFVESLGQPAFRGRQILPWLYQPGVIDFADMTDLAGKFRELLPDHAVISRFTEPITQFSRDGAVKFAFRLSDGKMIESVLIPEEDRNTLCLSTQVGCQMGCRFCMTGAMGFTRNLTTAEIVNQVCAVRDFILEEDDLRAGEKGRAERENKNKSINKNKNRNKCSGRLTNLVFMGMGEPLANFTNLINAISILTEQRGLDFSSRRITVSTCGLVAKMIQLGEETSVNLAISLHAPDDKTRNKIMPVNNRYPIAALLAGCKQFPHKKRQRIMFEYTLLEGLNDSDQQAAKLAGILRKIPCKINLLAMNETDSSRFKSPPFSRVLKFQKILRDHGYTVFIRQSRGNDISAACGQLAGEHL